MKDITKWTRKEFESLPQRGWREDIGLFDSLVILPQRTIHDSGYRRMDFVAVKDGIPLCRLSGCSDVIHLDGTGGFGKEYSLNTIPKGWSIDCLRVSGLLRLFSDGYMEAGPSLSSFAVYSYKYK